MFLRVGRVELGQVQARIRSGESALPSFVFIIAVSLVFLFS